jgi:hypothetical protein
MVPEPTDPLLNAWRMQWNSHAFLGGPTSLANLFNTNIFYPFPLTLAYSEHFLMMSAQLLPFLLIADSHLVGLNLAVLLTFILSGYSMYLLVTDWTKQPIAGLAAGVLFAFSPYRFGQLNHLELLVTEWMPLALLALHWTLLRPGWRYPLLFAIFFNLQVLSGFHYALNLTLACALLTLIYGLAGRIHWRRGLWLALVLSVLVTLALNWPIWRMYLRFNEVMGAVRTPGEVRIYSAALTDYLTTLPHNFLYGWTFDRWASEGHQFQPLMPLGLTGLLLALVALWFRPKSIPVALPVVIFLLLLSLLGMLLSFGLNENALGPGLAPLLKYSPYAWLYDHVLFFRGIRVPGRYGILVVLGLVGLAGWGVAGLLALIGRRFTGTKSNFPEVTYSTPGQSVAGFTKPIPQSPRRNFPTARDYSREVWPKGIAPLLMALILLETWSAPLVGPEFPAGSTIPPVYQWLERETSPETVVLELPFQESSEFLYEYYASYHWRRLANGGTGYTPPIYKALRQWFTRFPDPRSVDVAQQLGIDLIILHLNAYPPDQAQQLMADLPLYWPAIKRIDQIDNDLILSLGEPSCQAQPEPIEVTTAPAELDGIAQAVAVTYHNPGPAAFVADVNRTSWLAFADGSHRDFTEPLVTPAGESQAVIIPLQDGTPAELSGAWLASLDRTISTGEQAAPLPSVAAEAGQPLGLKFAGGPELRSYRLDPEQPEACSLLTVTLDWQGGQLGETALVQLLDPFGRVVLEDEAQPWQVGQTDVRTLPLPGSLPPGRHGLRVLVRDRDGQERLPVTGEGVTIPSDQIPPLPVIIHPQPDPAMIEGAVSRPALFNGGISLQGVNLASDQLAPGDWLRFALIWQVEQPIDAPITVFTQLLGSDGQVWGQRDNPPGGGWYGMPLWRPGQPVVDHYAFQIRPETPAGVYRLIAGLYRSDTLERIPLQTGGDFVEVATVQVGGPDE